MSRRLQWLEFRSSAALEHARAAFPRRLKRFVMAGGLRKARPEPKSMVLCPTDTCRAGPPAPEVINMHLQPPRPLHCPAPSSTRPGTALSSWHLLVISRPAKALTPGFVSAGEAQPDCSRRVADFEICLIKILSTCFHLFVSPLNSPWFMIRVFSSKDTGSTLQPPLSITELTFIFKVLEVMLKANANQLTMFWEACPKLTPKFSGLKPTSHHLDSVSF